MQVLHILASEGGGAKNLWDPTILGVLTVLSGVVLFCGSTYMLLTTNIGARQGFLVAFCSLTGITMLLGALWLTTNTPLNVPKGRVAQWIPVSEEPTDAIVANLSDSAIQALRSIDSEGTPVPEKGPADSDVLERGELRPAVEAALVKEKTEGPHEVEAGPLVLVCDTCAGDVITNLDELNSYTIGGGTKNLFWHNTQYAAVEFCTRFALDPVFADPSAEIKDAECDPAIAHKFLLLKRDFGSLRLPALFYTLVSGLLLGLGLYAMHIKERSEQRTSAGALTPTNA